MTVTTDERALLIELARTSHSVIVANQQPGGAYPASPTFSAYQGYCWLRDGSFIAEGMSRFGDSASVDAFHDWVASALLSRRAQVDSLLARQAAGKAISNDDMLPTRFAFSESGEEDSWWNFQTDGYGMWLWQIVTHAARHNGDLERWRAGIEVAADYVTAFWAVACYDWWEENVTEVHVSTLGAIYGGLVAVAASGLLDERREAAALVAASEIRNRVLEHGLVDGHLTKWLGSGDVDASLAACIVPFGLVSPGDPIAAATLREIKDQLDAGGGVHRYSADVFFGGGQWLLLSCLVGWNDVVAGDSTSALSYLQWVAAHTLEDGIMPEQVPDHLLHPDSRAEWVDLWGPVAAPLLWSHGMYLILADELGLLAE